LRADIENRSFPSKVLERAVEEISGLPGIGRRTAIRLALHLLKQPKTSGLSLGKAIENLVTDIKYCKECHNFSDSDVCEICSSARRDDDLLCVVEDARDVLAIENTGQYRGKYVVLGGKLSPMEGVGPSNLRIDSILKKVESGMIKEIIFALSATMEGDTTAYYIYRKIKHMPITFSIIARGISVGDELEYADEISLGRSIKNRQIYQDS